MPMTDIATPPEPDAPADRGKRRAILIAVIAAVLVIGGIKLWLLFWWRRGGPRRAVTSIAEDGAVKLADAVLDEIFGPAA
jgi:ferric-dicitrate binding protein FerR (iron transport regulator)